MTHSVKKKIWITVAAILVALIGAAAVVGSIIFVPLYSSAPFKNTFEELLFDSSEINEVMGLLEESGYESNIEVFLPSRFTGLKTDLTARSKKLYKGSADKVASQEITLEVDPNTLTLKLFYDRDKITIGGYTDGYIVVPRNNIRGRLSEAPFAPGSGEKYTLSEAEFDRLVDAVESFASEEDASRATEQLYETFGNNYGTLIKRFIGSLSEKSSISVADGSTLIRTVEYKMNGDSVIEFFSALADEYSTNEAIKALADVLVPPKKSNSDAEGEDALNARKQELTKFAEKLIRPYEKLEITFGYVIDSRHVRNINAFILTEKSNGVENTISINADFNYGDTLGFEALIKTEKKSGDGTFEKTSHTAEYIKSDSDNEFRIYFGVSPTRYYTSGSTHSNIASVILAYDKLNGDYNLTFFDQSSPNQYLRFAGNYRLNKGNRSIALSVYKKDINSFGYGDKLIDVSFKKYSHGEITAPQGVDIATLNKRQLFTHARNLPFSTVASMTHNLAGVILPIMYTAERAVIFDPDGLEEITDTCKSLYREQLKKSETVPDEIMIYLHQHEVYLLLMTSDINYTRINAVYYENDIAGYAHAELTEDGKLIIEGAP